MQRRNSSISRVPTPYSGFVSKAISPLRKLDRTASSSRVSTLGIRFLCAGRQAIEPGHANGQHLPVQDQDGAERLFVGGRLNLPLAGQHFEERIHLGRAHLARVVHHPATVVPADET